MPNHDPNPPLSPSGPSHSRPKHDPNHSSGKNLMSDSAPSGAEAPIRAVIFDMDGVLVDSEPLLFEAERILLAEFGAELTEEIKKPFIGLGGMRCSRLCWTTSVWRLTSPPWAGTRARS